jgi:hypothetical protein
MTQYGERWFDEFQLLAGAGFVVVATNPHGSSGREDPFGRAIRSPKASIDPGTGWGGIDADDLLAVLDATLARWPALDPARVGVLGDHLAAGAQRPLRRRVHRASRQQPALRGVELGSPRFLPP